MRTDVSPTHRIVLRTRLEQLGHLMLDLILDLRPLPTIHQRDSRPLSHQQQCLHATYMPIRRRALMEVNKELSEEVGADEVDLVRAGAGQDRGVAGGDGDHRAAEDAFGGGEDGEVGGGEDLRREERVERGHVGHEAVVGSEEKG